MVIDITQGLVNLNVGRELSLAKSFNDTIEANLQFQLWLGADKWGCDQKRHLSVNVRLFVDFVDGIND
jgi:hypothetical protein